MEKKTFIIFSIFREYKLESSPSIPSRDASWRGWWRGRRRGRNSEFGYGKSGCHGSCLSCRSDVPQSKPRHQRNRCVSWAGFLVSGEVIHEYGLRIDPLVKGCKKLGIKVASTSSTSRSFYFKGNTQEAATVSHRRDLARQSCPWQLRSLGSPTDQVCFFLPKLLRRLKQLLCRCAWPRNTLRTFVCVFVFRFLIWHGSLAKCCVLFEPNEGQGSRTDAAENQEDALR